MLDKDISQGFKLLLVGLIGWVGVLVEVSEILDKLHHNVDWWAVHLADAHGVAHFLKDNDRVLG